MAFPLGISLHFSPSGLPLPVNQMMAETADLYRQMTHKPLLVGVQLHMICPFGWNASLTAPHVTLHRIQDAVQAFGPVLFGSNKEAGKMMGIVKTWFYTDNGRHWQHLKSLKCSQILKNPI